MKNNHRLFCLIVITLIPITLQISIYDDSQIGLRNETLSTIDCNKNSLNDFTFSSSSILTCNTGNCFYTNPSLNTVNYLDVNNVQRTYTLSSVSAVIQNFIGGLAHAFLFTYLDPTKAYTLYLAVPFDKTSSITGNYTYQAINLLNTTDSAFTNLVAFGNNPDTALASGIPLSAFNFLTTLSYNQFYSVMDSTFSKTLLVSRTLLTISSTATFTGDASSGITFLGDYKKSGDVFCWGQFSAGQFQTHMRESVPMWFFLLSVMMLWMFVLLGDQNTNEVFQRSFANNKWTSWSLYSLYYLAHQQFFTRMSRGALMYASIIWQAMVISIIYSYRWSDQGNSIIIWSAVVAWFVSIPYPYIFGNIFLKKIYAKQQSKLQKRIEQHNQIQKQKRQAYQRDAILLGQQIYSINYWYYATIIIMLGVFSILSVHIMQSIPSINYFYRNWQWLISMAVVIGWQHLILDPILTLCFGDRPWYQNRGYYYNAELSQNYRKAD